MVGFIDNITELEQMVWFVGFF